MMSAVILQNINNESFTIRQEHDLRERVNVDFILTLTAPEERESVNDRIILQQSQSNHPRLVSSGLWYRCVNVVPHGSRMRSDGFTALRTGDFQNWIS